MEFNYNKTKDVTGRTMPDIIDDVFEYLADNKNYFYRLNEIQPSKNYNLDSIQTLQATLDESGLCEVNIIDNLFKEFKINSKGIKAIHYHRKYSKYLKSLEPTWDSTNPVKSKILIGILSALFSLGIGIILYRVNHQSEVQKYKELQIEQKAASDRIDSLIHSFNKAK